MNYKTDIFLHDLLTGQTTKVSVNPQGGQSNGHSDLGDISYNGRFLAFTSLATKLVAGDTNEYRDVFLRDLIAGTTDRVSVSSDGAQGNDYCDSGSATISDDGRFVAFESDATNLVPGDTNGREDVFIRDRNTNATTRVSVDSDGSQGTQGGRAPSLSADGRYVAFSS